MALVRDQAAEEEAFYLVTFLRERTDGVGGMFGKMLKRKAEEAARGNLERDLQATQPLSNSTTRTRAEKRVPSHAPLG